MKSKAIENNIPKILEVLKSSIASLQAVYLFGSQTSGDATPSSDIDIASLEKKNVDLVDLRKASTVFRMQVIAKGSRTIVEGKSDIEIFEDNVFSDYARLNEERKYILSDIQEQGSVYAR